MKTATATTESRAPDAEDSGPRRFDTGLRSRLWWWLPVALAVVYALALIPELPAIITHTWWSADSASAGVVAQLYSHPPTGQYIVLGNHGWYETLSFDLLTRGLAGHRLLWYLVPIAVWVMTIALIGVSAGRAFGRYAAGLVVAGLMCLAPGGLMVVFQPTAHTNVIFHAAVLALVAGWVLPRIRVLPLPLVLAIGVLIGAFTGLAVTGDAVALAWAVLPFVVAAGLCAWRGPMAAAARTLAFALATLTAMLVVTVVFTGIMHRAGFRVDELAQSEMARFVQPNALAGNAGMMLNELTYLVGGNFLGHRIAMAGLIELASGGILLIAAGGVLVAIYKAVATRPERPSGGDAAVSPRLVHVAFWSTCLVVGLLMFVLSSVGSIDYRYLVGPVVAIAALLPLAVARGRDWRIAVAAGLSVLAVAGLVRLDTRPLPYLPTDSPLASRDIATVNRFAQRYHVHYGYAVYWDAVTIPWESRFNVQLHSVTRCGWRHRQYCPLYHADSFTASYIPRKGLRTLFIGDARFRSTPARSWGKPIASERIGRLTLYAYNYDIASRLLKPYPGEIHDVITGHVSRHGFSPLTGSRPRGGLFHYPGIHHPYARFTRSRGHARRP